MRRLLLHIPHSSLYIPESAKTDYFVNIDELQRLNLEMTDLYTEQLFSHPQADILVFPFSRLYCDVEKFADDNLEVMSKYGMGFFYTKTLNQTPLRSEDPILKEKILNEVYIPHHSRLDEFVRSFLGTNEELLILDCHSFSDAMVQTLFQKNGNPDICLGFDEEFVDKNVIEWIRGRFETEGYSVAYNYPYSGSIVPNVVLNQHTKYSGVKSVMIELNKRIYLNDDFTPSTNYHQVKNVLFDILTHLIQHS